MVAPAKHAPAISDTSGWLTATQASDLLGVSRTSLARWERQGLLHPQRSARGDSAREIIVYDPDELTRMPRKFRHLPSNDFGELSACVFELLDEGKSVREIVIQTREPASKIEDLRQQWLDAGGADIVIGKEAREEIERITRAPFRSVRDVVIMLERAAATIVATVPDDASDGELEQAITSALDVAIDAKLDASVKP